MVTSYLHDIEEIEANAFANCTNLARIRLPKSFTSTGNPFEGCEKLTTVYSSEGSETEKWAKDIGIAFVPEK